MFVWILLFFSFGAQALEFKIEAPVELQSELKKISSAITKKQKQRLPKELKLSFSRLGSLPLQANCNQDSSHLYVSSQLEINDQILSLIENKQFKTQIKGCSHKIALFLAFEKVLPNFYTNKKIKIARRSFSPTDMDQILEASNTVVRSTHDQVAQEEVNVTTYPIDNDEFFMVSNFKISRVIGKHNYRVGVNPKIFDLDISKEALSAIVAHELEHTLDYIKGSFIGRIVPIGISLLIKKYRYRYERQTDLKTVLKGYGQGLIAYRNWQYLFLDKKALKVKKENYLTPAEIALIMSHLPQQEERIRKALRGRAPKNLGEWRDYFN